MSDSACKAMAQYTVDTAHMRDLIARRHRPLGPGQTGRAVR